MSQDTIRKTIQGRAVAVPGNDIDTDQIIPARFMKGITFEGLEAHVFEDVRFDQSGKPKGHPFDEPKNQGASVLVVNKNFGCGSSREHAPQALMRWGIRGIIGESFAEIFFGNCVTLGIPVVTAGAEVVQTLMQSLAADPKQEVTIDVAAKSIRYSGGVLPCEVHPGAQKQWVEGTWDGTSILLSAKDEIAHTAQRLPYIAGF